MIKAIENIPYFEYPILKNNETVMIPFFRYVNSENREIDLTKAPFIGELSNDLLGFKWTPVTQGQAIQKIVKFEKYMIEKKFHVLISGNNAADYYGNLEKFLQTTDKDINNLKTGRLYVGDYYLDCYITANTKSKRYLGTHKTMLQVTAVCERGNWQSEHDFRFSPLGSEGNEQYTGNGITYPYDYDYDYAAPFTREELVNESYMDTDFELTFYGATDNPEIIIGGNTYGFDYQLASNEYIKVNSKEKTCIVYKNNGTTENVFKYRSTVNPIYQKIKGGASAVTVSDENATVDIKLFYERSEPKWGNELWI